MRDGSVIQTALTWDVNRARPISLMTGRDMSTLFPPRIGRPSETCLVMSVDSLCGSVICAISFQLHAGEILGIARLVGSGGPSFCGPSSALPRPPRVP